MCIRDRVVVAEGDKLSLGKHELTFVMAPMVHWPEVMMEYESTDKVLFSAEMCIRDRYFCCGSTWMKRTSPCRRRKSTL